MKIGSGNQGQFTFIDVIGLMSFIIGLENLGMNLTQDDKQELQQDFSDKADRLLQEMHSHLQQQDNKIDIILDILKRMEAPE